MSLSKTYEFRKITVELGTCVVDNFFPGSVLRTQRNHEDFLISGENRIRNTDRSGLISFSLLESSDSNKLLMNFFKADQNYNRGTFPITIKDRNHNLLHKAELAWVKKISGYPEIGIEPGERRWVLETSCLESF